MALALVLAPRREEDLGKSETLGNSGEVKRKKQRDQMMQKEKDCGGKETL